MFGLNTQRICTREKNDWIIQYTGENRNKTYYNESNVDRIDIYEMMKSTHSLIKHLLSITLCSIKEEYRHIYLLNEFL